MNLWKLALTIAVSVLAALTLGWNPSTPSGPTVRAATQVDLTTLVAPERVGLDAAPLEELARRAEAGYWGRVDSVHVARRGQLAFERHFRGYDGQTPHRMYSVTKSVTSLLVGIALDQGHIPGLDRTLLSFFPEYAVDDIANMDERKARITLDDLLTMRAGFRWDEWTFPYTDPRNDTTPLFASDDWMKHMLDLPMAHEPGTVFTYSSGVTMLLSGILRNATGMTAREFAAEHLFGPLGITQFGWEEGPDGIFNTGWGLFLKPRDMLRLGQLVLDGGRWDGVQVVPEDWVRQSTLPTVVRSSTTGYGFQWWTMPLLGQSGRSSTLADVPYAAGWGGQHIFVVPALELVVAVTGANYQGAPRSPRTMVFDFVAPAVDDGV